MKILDINQFVSERMQIKPVTNAELAKIEKQIKRMKKTLDPNTIKCIERRLTSGYPLKKTKIHKTRKG